MEHWYSDIILVGLLILSEIRHYLEKRDMKDRLMARSFPELVTFQNERKTVKIPDRADKVAGIEL